MTGRQGVSGTVLITVAAGSLLAYSAIKGKSFSGSLKTLIAGGSPADAPSANQIADAGTTAVPAGDPSAPQGSNIVVAAAVSQLGKPYVWDTPTNFAEPNPVSFDCSGLTGWAYYRAGIKLAHFTGAQYAQLQHRPFAEAALGDLVFYATNAVDIYHVAMFVGGGQVIEAPEAGIPVRYRAVKAGDKDLMAMVGVYPGGQGA